MVFRDPQKYTDSFFGTHADVQTPAFIEKRQGKTFEPEMVKQGFQEGRSDTLMDGQSR